MADALTRLATWAGLLMLVLGLGRLTFAPLAVFFEVRANMRRRRADLPGRPTVPGGQPWVSVIVPAYNEGPTIRGCLRSILASDHGRLEVVVVDDGSTDDTLALVRAMAADEPRLRVLTQANQGKGAALNHGIAESGGEVLLFVDADGIFARDTVTELLRGFDHPSVGAVCGDDRPVNLDRVQTRMLALLSHVGTGLVRRALVVLGCLPIVSGNVGAFTRSVVEELGGFRQDTVAEDLELTWRVHRAGYRVAFAPRALVHAESPSTVAGLWRQRVRWGRGLLQTTRIHARMVGNPRHGSFGLYLAYNTLAGIVVPVLQVLLLLTLPLLVAGGATAPGGDAASVLAWVGLGSSIAMLAVALCLNRAWRDLRHGWAVVLWPFYSVVMAAVMCSAVVREVRGRPARWDKLARTGVVSLARSRRDAGLPTRA